MGIRVRGDAGLSGSALFMGVKFKLTSQCIIFTNLVNEKVLVQRRNSEFIKHDGDGN